LPFTTTIENKPPLALIFQTAALAISNHDLITLRLICSIIVSITGILIGLSVSRLTKQGNWPIIVFSSAFYTYLVSTIPSGLSWGSEINTNFIFVLLIFTLVIFLDRGSLLYFCLSSIFAGLLPLFRTNWLPISFLCLTYLFLMGKNKFWRIALIFISLSPVALISLIYTVKGVGAELYKFAFQMPLFINFISVSENRFTRPQGADKYLFISLLFYCIAYFFVRTERTRMFLNFFSILLLTQYIILAIQSPNYAHHTIQLVPFLVFFSMLSLVLTVKKIKLNKSLFIFASTVFILSIAISAPSSIFGDNENNGNVSYVQMKRTSEWVKSFNQDKVWALNSHYIYWMDALTPPKPYLTHPSHIYVPGFVDFIRNERHPISKYIDEIIASDVAVFYLNPNPDGVDEKLDDLKVRLLRDGYAEKIRNFGGKKFSFWEK
jgi:hypothetical protein